MKRKSFLFPLFLGLMIGGSLLLRKGPSTPWEILPIVNDNRDEHGFIELHGKFYLIGGSGKVKPTLEFDPSTNRWRALEVTTPTNFNHFQAVTFQDRIWIICAWEGYWPNEKNVTHVWSLDPDGEGGKGTWHQGMEIPPQRRRGSAGVVLYGDQFYIVNGLSNGHSAPEGGNRFFDRYDPHGNDGKGHWEVLPDAPRTRDHFHAALVKDKIYLIGGRNNRWTGKGEFSDIVTDIDVYDMTKEAWLKDEDMATDLVNPRSGSTVISMDDEIVLLGGVGYSRDQEFSSVEVLNVRTGTWRMLPSMNSKRSGTQAIFFDGKIWIASGEASAGEKAENLEVVSWKELAKQS